MVTCHQFEQLYDSLLWYVLLVGIWACAFVLRGLVRQVWALGIGGVGGEELMKVGIPLEPNKKKCLFLCVQATALSPRMFCVKHYPPLF